jgi:hypothetical protein
MDYMDVLSRMVSVPRRASIGVLDWINDNPLPTAGVTMAAIAGGYLIVLIQRAASKAGTSVGHLDPGIVLAIVRSRPAYVLAIVVGISVLTLWRER